MTPVRTAARALLGSVFVMNGARAVTDPEQLTMPAKRVTDRIVPLIGKVDPRLPTDTRTLVQINGGVQLLCGLLLVTPLRRPAAALLAGSLAATTVAGHPYWQHEDPDKRGAQLIQFQKNLAMLGGLLLAATDTGGRPGLRWRAGHMADHLSRAARNGARQAVRVRR